jgi:putative transposase
MKKLKLKPKEVMFLKQFIRKGQKSARALTRANILLLLNRGETGDDIANRLNVHRDTVYNVKKRYLKERIDVALFEKQRPGQPVKYDKKKKAEIIAYACTTPPEGRKRWTVRLLVEELRGKKEFKTINRESVRLILKKTTQNHG